MANQVPHTFDVLTARFDTGAVARGVTYVRDGMVEDVTVRTTDRGHEVLAVVHGSGARNYVTQISIDERPWGPDVVTTCTCPVGDDCKHAAAVLRIVSTQPFQAVPDWDDRLTRILGDVERSRPALAKDATPLALQFEHRLVATTWRGGPEHIVTVRVVRRGSRDNWVKTGVGWNDIRYGWASRQGINPEQWSIARDIGAAFAHSHAGQNPRLADFGPVLWPLLRRAVATGIDIIPGTGLADVQLEPGTFSPAVEVQGTDDLGIVLELRDADQARLDVGDATVGFLGSPAHGVTLLDEVDASGYRQSRQFTLRLVELSEALTEPLQRLVSHREVIRVPKPDRDRFMTDFLPRLRRQLPTTSSDGSVDLPEPEPPTLVASVRWLPEHTAELTWWWQYRFGETQRRAAVHSRDGLVEFRDAEAERALVAELQLDDRPGLHVPIHGGLPLPRQEFAGQALLHLVDVILPLLHTIDGLDVEESGERPDYRPAVNDPQISFDLADTDGDRTTDWLDLSIAISVDGENVPLGAVLAALTLGDGVIFTESGRHVSASHPAFQQLAELVAAAGDIIEQPKHGLRVGRTDLALWNELETLGIVDAQAEQWLASARALRDFDTLPDVEPPGVTSELRSYQASGLRWLAYMWRTGLGAVLADDMGLGKTLQALALIAHARENGAPPFLVIAPTSVVGAWVQQAAIHTPGLKVAPVVASAKRRDESIAELFKRADVVVTSYTLFRLEASDYAEQSWGGLILDEAHNIKNHQGKTYQSVRRLEVPFRLALTGTPFENRLMELWSLLSVTAPGLYPSPKRFNEVVAIPVEKRGDQAALERFRRRIRPFLLRRTKELVAADLPPKQEQVLDVQLNAKHRRIYDTHLQRERQTVLGLVDDFEHQRIAIFRSLTRLRQLSLDAVLVDDLHADVGSAKIDLLVEHLHELIGEGHRALVFSQFTSFLALIRARLEREGIDYAYLDGRTRNRPKVIDGFRESDTPVFLISLKAGGVGLTLTEADYVFVLDPWWNPAVEAQAVDRAHRIGQDRPVMVYRLVAEGTIEEKVMELKARKEALFSQVIDGDDFMASEITADDIRGLFE